MGTIDGFDITDLDYSEDSEVIISINNIFQGTVRISYTTVVQMYEGLMENHPGYPEIMYQEMEG